MKFFFAETSVVSEIWGVTIWSPPENTGTKLARIKSYIERLI